VEQAELLKFAIQTLERVGIQYALVGSFASGVWGESRFTQNIDLLIELTRAQVQPLCAAFPETDIYVSEEYVSRFAARLGVADIWQSVLNAIDKN